MTIANPWFSEVTQAPTRLPQFPDLVPPGHFGGDWIRPAYNVLQMAKHRLRHSRVIVFCGLSGREPDRSEVEGLIGAISDDAVVIQVGLRANGDDENDVARLLATRDLRAAFLDAEEVARLPDAIFEHLP